MSRRAARRAPVPVIVVAGYLGAGKSTLLNHLLRVAHGARIGVVVNDFGEVNIDAMLVAGQVDGAVAMSNGCLCCAVDDDDFDDALGRLARAGMDAVVVEASGIAEPGAIVRRVVLSADPRVAYGGLVYLVDAAEFAQTLDTHPSLRHHVALADLVVLNKIDLADDPDGVGAAVSALAAGAPVLATVDGAVHPDLLFDVPDRREADAGPRQLTLDELLRESGGDHAGCAGSSHDGACHDGACNDCACNDCACNDCACNDTAGGHLHDRYQAVDVAVDVPLDARRVAALLEGPPPGVYRVKGFVHVADGTRFEVHTVGRQVRTTRCAGTGSVLVFIGRDIDADDVRARVRACAAAPDREPGRDAQATISLTRFSRDG